MKTYKPIPPLNPHTNCKGHAMSILDDTYETQESRDLLDKILSNYSEDKRQKIK